MRVQPTPAGMGLAKGRGLGLGPRSHCGCALCVAWMNRSFSLFPLGLIQIKSEFGSNLMNFSSNLEFDQVVSKYGFQVQILS
jgi:hypothetical protein